MDLSRQALVFCAWPWILPGSLLLVVDAGRTGLAGAAYECAASSHSAPAS